MSERDRTLLRYGAKIERTSVVGYLRALAKSEQVDDPAARTWLDVAAHDIERGSHALVGHESTPPRKEM